MQRERVLSLTWVILSTETGMPSMVRGGSSEASSPPAGACSARAFSRSSNIMPLYFLTWRTDRQLQHSVSVKCWNNLLIIC